MQAVNNINSFIKVMNELLIKKSSIGIQGITFNNEEELVELLTLIMNNGLKCEDGTILNTMEICGDDADCNYRKLYNYVYYGDNNYIANVIVNIPIVLEGSRNRKYFVGDFRVADIRNGYPNFNDEISSLWFSRYVQKRKCIPPEFILGSDIYDIPKGKTNFIANTKFLGCKSERQRHLFVDKFIEDVQKTLKSCLIIELDDSKIDKIYSNILHDIEMCERLSKNTYYLEQAKEYIESTYKLGKNRNGK